MTEEGIGSSGDPAWPPVYLTAPLRQVAAVGWRPSAERDVVLTWDLPEPGRTLLADLGLPHDPVRDIGPEPPTPGPTMQVGDRPAYLLGRQLGLWSAVAVAGTGEVHLHPTHGWQSQPTPVATMLLNGSVEAYLECVWRWVAMWTAAEREGTVWDIDASNRRLDAFTAFVEKTDPGIPADQGWAQVVDYARPT